MLVSCSSSRAGYQSTAFSVIALLNGNLAAPLFITYLSSLAFHWLSLPIAAFHWPSTGRLNPCVLCSAPAQQAGPFSAARLKMDLPFHNRLVYSRVHRKGAGPLALLNNPLSFSAPLHIAAAVPGRVGSVAALLAQARPCRTHCLALPRLDLSLPFHCLALIFHCPSHCLALTVPTFFHCPCLDRSHLFFLDQPPASHGPSPSHRHCPFSRPFPLPHLGLLPTARTEAGQPCPGQRRRPDRAPPGLHGTRHTCHRHLSSTLVIDTCHRHLSSTAFPCVFVHFFFMFVCVCVLTSRATCLCGRVHSTASSRRPSCCWPTRRPSWPSRRSSDRAGGSNAWVKCVGCTQPPHSMMWTAPCQRRVTELNCDRTAGFERNVLRATEQHAFPPSLAAGARGKAASTATQWP